MNMQEYQVVKSYTYDELCQYLNQKYGPVRNVYGRKGCARPEDGLFVHHVREDQVASLSNYKVRKANDPVLQEPQNLVYCDYLEHLLLHIKIGELTACGRNLGLVGPFVYIIPALRVFFENGHKNSKVNPKYFEVIANDGDVFEELLIRYNQLIEDIDLLLDHNQTLYVEMVRMLEEKKKACVVLGTGLGKTTTALQYVWKHGCKALVVGPNNLIKSGWDRYREWVHTMTYASFAKSFSLLDYSKFGIVILDETHHVGYDEEKDLGAKVWSQGIQYLFDHNIPVLGLTATPERTDGINIGETVFKDCVCQGLAIEEAIEQGIVHPFSYITSIYDPEGLAEEYKGRGDKELIGQLDLALNHLPTVKTTLLQYRPAMDKIKGIVFIAEIEDKDEAIAIMKSAYPDMEFRAIDSHMPDDEVIKNRDWFEQAEEGWLVAVNMISEGAHYPHVNTLVMFRHTTSYLVYTQQIGRIITLTKDENPNAVVFDFVNNVESVEYNDRKIKSKKTLDIKRVLSAIKLAAAKSPQVIVKDETRDIVDCIRKIKEYESDSWTPEEDEILRQWYPIEGSDVHKRLVFRSAVACTHRANYLNIFKQDESWTSEEDTIIKQYYPLEGTTVFKRLQNRTARACGARASFLNINYIDNKWTKEELSILKQYYPIEGLDCSKRLPNRTANAIRGRAMLLHLHIEQSMLWTEEEDNLLRTSYAQQGIKCAKLFPTRSKNAVQARASALKLMAPTVNKWTEAEDSILKQYYYTEGAEVVKRLQGRTKQATLSRAAKLGLNCLSNHLKNKKIRCIETGFVGTCKAVSEYHNVSPNNVSAVAAGRRKSTGEYHFEYVEE